MIRNPYILEQNFMKTIRRPKMIKEKKAYLARHKHDNYTNPLYAGFYSTNLLWNKPTLKESVKNTNEKYKNINIQLKSNI